MKAPGKGKGLFESLTDLAATLVGMAHSRIELICIDLEQERDYIFSLLIRSLLALLCLGIGLVLAIIAVVIAYWDTHRVMALGGMAGFFLCVCVATGITILNRVRARTGLLAASLTELSKDRQQLGMRS